MQAQPDPTAGERAISSELDELGGKEKDHRSPQGNPATPGTALFQRTMGQSFRLLLLLPPSGHNLNCTLANCTGGG